MLEKSSKEKEDQFRKLKITIQEHDNVLEKEVSSVKFTEIVELQKELHALQQLVKEQKDDIDEKDTLVINLKLELECKEETIDNSFHSLADEIQLSIVKEKKEELEKKVKIMVSKFNILDKNKQTRLQNIKH